MNPLLAFLKVTTRLDIVGEFRDFQTGKYLNVTLRKRPEGYWVISAYSDSEYTLYEEPRGYYNKACGPLHEGNKVIGTFDYSGDSEQTHFSLLEALKLLGGRWNEIATLLENEPDNGVSQ